MSQKAAKHIKSSKNLLDKKKNSKYQYDWLLHKVLRINADIEAELSLVGEGGLSMCQALG